MTLWCELYLFSQGAFSLMKDFYCSKDDLQFAVSDSRQYKELKISIFVNFSIHIFALNLKDILLRRSLTLMLSGTDLYRALFLERARRVSAHRTVHILSISSRKVGATQYFIFFFLVCLGLHTLIGK